MALAAAEEAAEVAPYRESAYRQLMTAHAAAGNRAEALRDYERCRALLSADLGVDPSPETQSLYFTLVKRPNTGQIPRGEGMRGLDKGKNPSIVRVRGFASIRAGGAAMGYDHG